MIASLVDQIEGLVADAVPGLDFNIKVGQETRFGLTLRNKLVNYKMNISEPKIVSF